MVKNYHIKSSKIALPKILYKTQYGNNKKKRVTREYETSTRGVHCRISDRIRSENFGSGKLRSESDPKFSDIRTFRIGSPGFRIGSPGFRIGYRVFGSGPLKFLKNPDPYPIRKPEIFSGYPIRNIRNL